ncbi:type I restriction enzyme HsdR N-terminal domain-containing protein [Thermoflavifilum thermophilum]|nr:type I restriction enzyme HsdR N-terminal domain-containing protein [Thermoflavifilum thermophilum]
MNRGQQRYIFDRIRKRYVALTPEEWVRQHVLHYLIDVAGYPSGLMAVEKRIPGHSQSRRADIVVYDPDLQPWMVVECKAPDVPLQEDTLMQIAGYNFPLQARYLFITNGHTCWLCDGHAHPPALLNQLPPWPGSQAST